MVRWSTMCRSVSDLARSVLALAAVFALASCDSPRRAALKELAGAGVEAGG